MEAPHAIDTKQPKAVAEAVKAAFTLIGAEESHTLLDQLFKDVTDMFEGRYVGYQAIDMGYHDYEHTLQATVCLVHMLEGRSLTTDQPELLVRDWELSVMAALLHDTGFLREVGDESGTGAKYTFGHELRSCSFTRLYLPSLGATPSEVEDVCSAIMCTGPRNKIDEVTFQRPEARQIAYFLVNADYLAQISAADYLEKLPKLYSEFQEAFETSGVQTEDRPYKTLRELLEKTPHFWRDFVLPLLDRETDSAYQYLSPPGQPNPYLVSIDANLKELTRRLNSGES